MRVIGLCRFSYPAIGGFQVAHETIEDRRQYLYQAARLEERFRLFETTTLPCFREQTDPDFELIILTGTCLPDTYLNRLKETVSGVQQIRIVQKDPGPHKEVTRAVLNAARRSAENPCIQFRHDDDDAVSVDFVERLRNVVNNNPGLMHRYESVGIDFNSGFLRNMAQTGFTPLRSFARFWGLGWQWPCRAAATEPSLTGCTTGWHGLCLC